MIIAIVLAVLGNVLAVYLYLNPISRKRLVCQMTSVLYFNEDDYNLPVGAAMTFRNTPVARLTKTSVVFWNAGTDALSGSDIVSDDPLRVAFDTGDKILSCRITQRTNNTNKARIVENAPALHELRLSYDYLNAKDAFVLELVHDSKKRHPDASGSIKGVAKGVEDLGEYLPYEHGIRSVVLTLINLMMVSAVMLDSFDVVRDLAAEFLPARLAASASWILPAAVVCLGIAVFVMEFWTKRRRYPTASLSL